MLQNKILKFVFISYLSLSCLALHSADNEKNNMQKKLSSISLEELKDYDLNNHSKIFDLLSKLKKDLNNEKGKIEEFEGLFFNLSNFLKDLNNQDLQVSDKSEKLNELSSNIKKLNALIDDSEVIVNLDKDLKNKISLLNELMTLLINSKGIVLDELEGDLDSLTHALEVMTDFLNEQESLSAENQQKEDLDDNNDNTDDKNDNDTSVQDADNTVDVDLNLENNLEVLKEDNLVPEKYSLKSEKEYLDNSDNISLAGDINKDKTLKTDPLSQNDKKDLNSKKQTDVKLNKNKSARKIITRAISNIDPRMGGYPVQFIHQILFHRDKVSNR